MVLPSLISQLLRRPKASAFPHVHFAPRTVTLGKPAQFSVKAGNLAFILPSGKRCVVSTVKNDRNGEPEVVLSFHDKFGKKFISLDYEEICELNKMIPRIEKYIEYFEMTSGPAKMD